LKFQPILVGLSLADTNKYKRVARCKEPIKISDHSSVPKHSQQSYPYYSTETIVNEIKHHQKRFTEDEITFLIADYANGMTIYELGDKYDCHRNTVSKVLKQHGVAVTINKIVSDSDLNNLIKLYNSGLTTPQLAEQLGMSKSTIKRYLRNNGVKMRTRWG
jgi:DNA-binding CsgD family transcriptional regulator